MPSLLDDLPEIDPPKAAYVSLGLASPLWLPFLGAASAGVAFWWMTRWMPPANLEAMLAVVQPAAPEEVAETVVAMTEAATEQAEAVVEETVEAVAETTEQVEAVADELVETTVAATTEAAETVAETAETTTAAVVEAVKAPTAAKKKVKAPVEAPLH